MYVEFTSCVYGVKSIEFSNSVVTPYHGNLVISKLWSIQSNALERSLKDAPDLSRLSLDSFNFFSIAIRQCFTLRPSGKSHCFGKRIESNDRAIVNQLIFPKF